MRPAPRKNWLEWTVFAIGAALILAITGYLAVQAIGPPRRDVRIAVTFGSPEPGPLGYQVPLEVRNDGTGPAVTVSVAVALERGGAAAERASVLIDYLPARSRRTGRVMFRGDPGEGTLVVQGVSYAEP
jgi:uncharacterized protein (TIGR02588 family)